MIVAGGVGLLVVAGLAHYALSSDVANPYSGTQLLIAVSSTAVGAWVAHRRPEHPLGWVLLLGSGSTAAWVFAGQPLIVQAFWHGAPSWVLRTLWLLMVWPWIVTRTALFIVAPSVVPDGWPGGVRRVVLWVGMGATAVMSASQVVVFAGQPMDHNEMAPITGFAQWASSAGERAGDVQWLASVAAIIGLVAAVARGEAARRRQQRWFVGGAAALAVPALVASASTVFSNFTIHSGTFDRIEQAASGLLPLALLVAVVHDRMLDIGVVVRRIVLYSLLTAGSAVVYVVVVGVAWGITGDGTDLAPVVGTGAVALAFQPLRAAAQRWVSRRIYGLGDEPYQVLTRLGRRMADVPGSHEALPALVAGIADGLRLPYVAVEVDLERDANAVVVAAAGAAVPDTERFPLLFAGEEIGRLLVAPRTPGERFRPRERALLADLAQHAGIVAHDALLAADLRRSRLDLVVAREEERRRVRGDLHDGLGPILASVSLGLEAAASRLDDQELVSLLNDLNTDLREAMQDIRRLVYGLRPPALDELGLVRALESFVNVGSPDGRWDVRIEVVGTDLPDLPAAVEVAAYRIALEAITNVRRHASAHRCTVTLTVRNGDLTIEVRDDGAGTDGSRVGVGIVSMRQRAEDLGGQLEFSPAGAGGTIVLATLPLLPAIGRSVPA